MAIRSTEDTDDDYREMEPVGEPLNWLGCRCLMKNDDEQDNPKSYTVESCP